MDSGLITALTGAVTTLGLAIGFFIKRADTRRQRREDQLIAHLNAQLKKVEADRDAEIARLRAEHRDELERERTQHQQELHKLNAKVIREQRLRHLVTKDARAWREQLIENGLDPDPAEWSELSEEVDL